MSATNSTHLVLTPPVRLAYLGQLGLVVLAIATTLLAAGAGEWRFAVVAVLAASCAWLVRSWLAAAGMLAACTAEDDTPVERFACDAASTAHAAAKQRWSTLEARRGTPEFDLWE
ncbi:MAG TPA: hypothetical protein VK163_07985, partial [Opitutaceae bacterium]|nr:hypothetical protein [Opitutaceae bacterium]